MSTFAVTVRKISKVYPHTNADRLELAQVAGLTYQFVIGKGAYVVGDSVVFFPIDSVLPPEFIAQQNIANFLSGKDKNRVRTVTLRGALSQGYVASVEDVKKYLQVETLPDNLTVALGVTKYEPPEIKISAGNLVRMPEHVSVYDIEGCDNYPHIVEMLMDIPCVITEKMEGSNAWATIDSDKKISVGQKNYTIESLPEGPEHSFWAVARRTGIIDALEMLSDIYPGSTTTIRSEMVGPGIQGNYYRFKSLMCMVYDIEVDRKYISYNLLEAILGRTGLMSSFVPVLAKGITLREWLAGRTIQQAANGVSIWNPKSVEDLAIYDIKKEQLGNRKLREGIVIKPVEEQFIVGFGRLFLKQRDPVYLDESGN
jgi:RNA ligase (TIGR02306 family)